MNSMTHYMELLATNQPWNLIIFMAIPVIMAETIAVSELFILFRRDTTSGLRKLNKIVGTFAGVYFLGIFIYLFFNAVIPISSKGDWRGFADVIAVGFYLSGVIPLLGITLLETGIIGRKKDTDQKMFTHAVFVGIFLVAAHIAMIFGMVNPSIFAAAKM